MVFGDDQQRHAPPSSLPRGYLLSQLTQPIQLGKGRCQDPLDHDLSLGHVSTGLLLSADLALLGFELPHSFLNRDFGSVSFRSFPAQMVLSSTSPHPPWTSDPETHTTHMYMYHVSPSHTHVYTCHGYPHTPCMHIQKLHMPFIYTQLYHMPTHIPMLTQHTSVYTRLLHTCAHVCACQSHMCVHHVYHAHVTYIHMRIHTITHRMYTYHIHSTHPCHTNVYTSYIHPHTA